MDNKVVVKREVTNKVENSKVEEDINPYSN